MSLSTYKKDLTRTIALVTIMLFVLNIMAPITLAGNKGLPSEGGEETDGDSLQCGTVTSITGFARKPINEIPVNDYYINFHYRYPSSERMLYYNVWGSYDGIQYNGVRLQQVDDKLIIGSTELNIKIEPDMWHNILIHIKEDNTFELFINGEQAKIGESYTGSQVGTGKMNAIGFIGDVASNEHCGMAYYDNIRVFTKDEIFVQEDFNGELEGWNFYNTSVSLADPPIDMPIPTLSEINISATRTSLVTGNFSEVAVTGVLNDGTQAVMGTAQEVLLESSNKDVINIEQRDGKYIAVAGSEGKATVTAKVTMHGITKEATIYFTVTELSEISGIKLQLDNTKLLIGDISRLIVLKELTDGSINPIDGIQDISFEISDPDVVSVNIDESGEFILKANKLGQSTIKAYTDIDGKQWEAELTIDVLDLERLKFDVGKPSLVVGDVVNLKAIAILEDGSEFDIDPSQLEIIRCISKNTKVADVKLVERIPTVTARHPGIADITVRANFRGMDLHGDVRLFISDTFEGNSLQCGTMISTRGFARKIISELSTDDYYVNFNYMYPSGQTMDYYNVWGSYDGNQYVDVRLIQLDDKLGVMMSQSTEFIDIRIEPDMWHNILIHVKEDETIEIFINGKQAKMGGNYTVPRISKGTMQAIGYIGDVSKDVHNGMAYFDNIRVFTKDELIAYEDFNGDIDGWQISANSEVHLANPPMNLSLPQLSRAELQSKRALMLGDTSEIVVLGWLSDGSLAVEELIQEITVESKNVDIIKIEKDGNRFTAVAVGEGIATITGEINLDGVRKEAKLDLIVSSESILSDISIHVEDRKLLEGDITELTIMGKMTDGTVKPIDISNNISFESSDSQIASVSVNENGKALLNAHQSGKAIITAYTQVNGIPRKADIEIEVFGLEGIKLDIGRSNLFIGDVVKVKVIGMLTDNSEIDLSDADNITCASSDYGVAKVEIVDGRPVIRAVGEGVTNITIDMIFRGRTESAVTQLIVSEVNNSKKRSSYYTQNKVAAAKDNIEKYQWAKSIRDGAVAKADVYIEKGHNFLWNIVTPQSIPRSYGVNQTLGCLNCGKEIDKAGNYPYIGKPLGGEEWEWKLECPNCHIKFPTNDFKAYYEGGLNENGEFDPLLAKKHNDELIADGGTGNLVNKLKDQIEANPELAKYVTEDQINDPNWGVDNGYGYIDENGNVYTFVAYYNHWFVWYGGSAIINDAITSLRDAYLYTGDTRYARAGVILLDRIADVYPYMDTSKYDRTIFLNSHGATGFGKVVGSIWETNPARDFCSAYDAFFYAIDDSEIIDFLSSKADLYELSILKKSPEGIRRNIEDGIVREIYPAVKSGRIYGNMGMHQSTLAMAAVVIDTMPETKEWLDFNFKTGVFRFSTTNPELTGGNLSALLINDVDRDGHGYEASPEYNTYWIGQIRMVADILEGYDLYPTADLYNNPKFRKMFFSMYPLMLSDPYSASIGDAGTTGGPITYGTKSDYIRGFEKYGDPILGQAAYYLNGNQINGIHGDIFSEDPERVTRDIEEIIKTQGPLKQDSTHLTGYGFTAHRDGQGVLARAYGMTHDFLSLKIIESTLGTKFYENSGTVQFENTAGSGHYIIYEFSTDKDDDYEIILKPFRATLYGIYKISIDGFEIGEFDFFGSGTQPVTIGDLYLDKGLHQIKFECIGKNESSTNYKMGLIQLTLVDSEDQALRDKEEGQDQKNTQRDIWLYHGRNAGGHGQRDALNLGIHAFGLDLAPDLGYPEFADGSPHRTEWISNTVSHNTVVVDRSKQNAHIVGIPKHFDRSEFVKIFDVEAPKVYPQTDMYRRTTAMITVDDENAYIVDFFRVKGGNEHHFSFHGAEGAIRTEGLNLTSQPTGTYAGADIEFGKRPSNDSVSGAGYMGAGFHWLKNVERDRDPGRVFSVDWNVKDTWNIYGNGTHADTDVHLRLTMLGEVDEIALADGVPPRNKPGNPTNLKYLIARRSGHNLNSVFTSIIEPYKGKRYIKSIESVPVTVNNEEVMEDIRAIKIVLNNGRIDYIVNTIHSETTYKIDGKFEFRGFFGLYSERDGKPLYSYINDGSKIGELSDEKAAIEGVVANFTKELATDNEITIETTHEVKKDDVVGKYIYIEDDGIRNAVYKIEGIKSQDGNRMILDIGDITPIRSFADAYDFDKGYVYDIKNGAKFRIPLSHETGDPIVLEDPKEREWVVADNISIKGVANMQGTNMEGGIPGEYEDDVYILGTPGQKRRLEGIMLELDVAPSDMMVVYRTYVQSNAVRPNDKDDDIETTWTDDQGKMWKREGFLLGKKGEKRRIEGIELKLINKNTGEEYTGYKIQYQTHIHEYGWDDQWMESGEFAGTKNKNQRVTAIRVKILKEKVK